MIYSRTGKLADNFYLLGHPAIPVYLLDGSSPVIFDAGLTMFGQRYIEDIENILGERQPVYCFCTKSGRNTETTHGHRSNEAIERSSDGTFGSDRYGL